MGSKRFRKWTGIILSFVMLLTLVPAMQTQAASAYIEITSLYRATTITDGRPAANEDANIIRYTTSPVSVTATIQGINASQVPNLYYEVTNVYTNSTVVEKSNKAQHDGNYTVTFNNVQLTEGLNKVVIKLDGSSVIASDAGWAYFTPTTSILDLKVNGQPFLENKIYPENPQASTNVVITGQAPNATNVTAQLFGDLSPKSLFLNGGTFLLTGDDMHGTSNPDFKLAGGDNLFTFVSSNNSKTFTVDKNLIYDNGKPFAFDARIQGIVKDEAINAAAVNTKYYLAHTDVVPGSVTVTTPSYAPISPSNFQLGVEPPSAGSNAGKSYITFSGSAPGNVLVSYGIGNDRLITTPTVTQSTVRIDALLKNNVNNLGAPEYRYLDVFVGGQRFGPYNLGGALPATRVISHTPTHLDLGYSATELTFYGQAMDVNGLHLKIERVSDGTEVTGVGLSGAPNEKGPNFATFAIPDTLTTAGIDYKFTLSLNGTPLYQNTFVVNDPTAATPLKVTNARVTNSAGTGPIKESYINDGDRDQRITFGTGTVDLDKVSVEIIDVSGASRGSGSGYTLSGQTVEYQLPSGLVRGDYKFRVTYDGHVVTERYFAVLPSDPPAPALHPITQQVLLTDYSNVTGAPAAPTHIVVHGENLGYDKAAITNARLVDSNSTNFITLDVHAVEDDYAVFRLANQTALDHTTTYHLQFDVGSTTLTTDDNNASTPGVYKPVLLDQNNPNPDYNNAEYSGQVFTGDLRINGTAVTGNQLTLVEANDPTTRLNLEGINLSQSKLSATITRENGDVISGLAFPAINVSVTGAVYNASFTLPPGISAGNYMLNVHNAESGTILLTKHPFTVVDPTLSGLTPDIMPVTDLGRDPIRAIGTHLGRNANLLELRFTSVETGLTTAQVTAQTVLGGDAAEFPSPAGLAKGEYNVTLLYRGQPVSAVQNFTVASEPASLKENVSWSEPNRYIVYDFSVEVPIGNEKYQLVEFKFYNTSADTTPPTTFSFNYMNPNLPYIDYVERVVGTSGLRISDRSVNEINELPSTFRVYTDKKTNKVNVYLGEYTASSTPYKTINTIDTTRSNATHNVFSFTLDNIPNGNTKLIVVPSVHNALDPARTGENPSGSKTYDLNVTSTPYLIVDNIYNGLVIKNETEISCVTVSQPCISGRLVNVPMTNYGTDNAEAVLKYYVNNVEYASNLTVVPNNRTFRAIIPTPLSEGRNTIVFEIYLRQNGVLTKVTDTTFEIFKFQFEAPNFLSLVPIEPNPEEVKYVPGNLEDSYATTESSVALSGQFTGAREIKLTVKRTGADGQPVPDLYDRRYNNFTLLDPPSANPNFFQSISPTTGHFSTHNIQLSPRGDTIFEFTITNNSNITVTKTITITREPRPYVFVYPKPIRNAAGQEQLNVNSNYVELQIDAEFADRVVIDKKEAYKKDVVVDGVTKKHFFIEIDVKKAGLNKHKISVFNGDQEVKGDFVIYNAGTSVPGAQFKTELKSKIKAFNGDVELSFPRGTIFKRNGTDSINPFLTGDRKILFGIADPEDGRIDKYKHPATYDGQTGNPNPTIIPDAKFLLMEPTGRFRPASQLYWIDAGTIRKDEDPKEAIEGSGKLPYDNITYYNRTLEDLVVPTNEGTLTIKYDDFIVRDAWKYLTVYHYDIYEDATGITKARWRNIGGVVNTSKKTITVPLERFGYYQVMYMDQSFDDIISHPWGRDDLDTLYAKGYMLPKSPPSNFSPNDPITRGEFATMIVKLLELPLNYTENPTFTDVLRVNPLANGLYDYKYIETAARAGIIRGSGGGRFMPDNSITRQDAAVIIARALELKLSTDIDKSVKAVSKFTDANDIENYTVTSVEAVEKAGLITGKPNQLTPGEKQTYRFDPKGSFTRAEAAAVAIRILKQQKKIPK